MGKPKKKKKNKKKKKILKFHSVLLGVYNCSAKKQLNVTAV
jgi:hypothetical protein